MKTTTMGRVDGAVKVVSGTGGLCAAACCLLLGWWIALPVGVYAGWRMGQGVAQAVTGWSDED